MPTASISTAAKPHYTGIDVRVIVFAIPESTLDFRIAAFIAKLGDSPETVRAAIRSLCDAVDKIDEVGFSVDWEQPPPSVQSMMESADNVSESIKLVLQVGGHVHGLDD